MFSMHRKGSNDMSKAKKFRTLIKQAKMGKPHSMYQLGICYQLGRGIKQDMSEACAWIAASAEAGYLPAIEWMKDYYFDDDACTQANS